MNSGPSPRAYDSQGFRQRQNHRKVATQSHRSNGPTRRPKTAGPPESRPDPSDDGSLVLPGGSAGSPLGGTRDALMRTDRSSTRGMERRRDIRQGIERYSPTIAPARPGAGPRRRPGCDHLHLRRPRSWLNPQDNVPGSQPGDPVITNGVPTSSISWGGANPQSGYDVTISIPDPTTMFPVAVFSHRNFTVPDPSLDLRRPRHRARLRGRWRPDRPADLHLHLQPRRDAQQSESRVPTRRPPGEGCTDRVTFVDVPNSRRPSRSGGRPTRLGLTFLDDRRQSRRRSSSPERAARSTLTDLDT